MRCQVAPPPSHDQRLFSMRVFKSGAHACDVTRLEQLLGLGYWVRSNSIHVRFRATATLPQQPWRKTRPRVSHDKGYTEVTMAPRER